MFSGNHTLGDGMRRHLVTLEREERNLQQSISLCQQLQNEDIPVTALDTDAILTQMEELERSGATFQNKQRQDVRIRYVAPVVMTLLMIGLMFALILLVVWGYTVSPEDAPPIWFLFLIAGVCLTVCGGALLALIQRIREIGKGEIDDAKFY